MIFNCFHMKTSLIGKFLADLHINLGHTEMFAGQLFKHNPFFKEKHNIGSVSKNGALSILACKDCGEVFIKEARVWEDPSLLYLLRRFGRLPSLKNGHHCRHEEADLIKNMGNIPPGYANEDNIKTNASSWLLYRCRACSDIIAVMAKGSLPSGLEPEIMTTLNISTKWFVFDRDSLPGIFDALKI